MDVVEAIHGRRSIRSYATTPVGRDIIESIILDAAQAPPPFSGEVPWTFNVVQGVDRIAALGKAAMSYAKAHHRPDESGWGWLAWPDFKIFWDAPVLIIISGCESALNFDPTLNAQQDIEFLGLSGHMRGVRIGADRDPSVHSKRRLISACCAQM